MQITNYQGKCTTTTTVEHKSLVHEHWRMSLTQSLSKLPLTRAAMYCLIIVDVPGFIAPRIMPR